MSKGQFALGKALTLQDCQHAKHKRPWKRFEVQIGKHIADLFKQRSKLKGAFASSQLGEEKTVGTNL